MTDGVNWKLGVVQMDCALGDRQANLGKIESFAVAAARQGVELVVAPETATTGYFIAPRLAELAEPADGPTARALAGIARTNRLHLAVGMATREGERYFDSLLLFSPEGKLLAD